MRVDRMKQYLLLTLCCLFSFPLNRRLNLSFSSKLCSNMNHIVSELTGDQQIFLFSVSGWVSK